MNFINNEQSFMKHIRLYRQIADMKISADIFQALKFFAYAENRINK